VTENALHTRPELGGDRRLRDDVRHLEGVGELVVRI
jgi:hypothetical protein